jgi:asparagine synthase (glutamine-hydrolysing)
VSGICGVIAWHADPLPPDTLQRMADAAPHRAPHGTHTWTSPHAHLARLARHTTPEDHHDHQPLTHHHLTLVADARIDNRDDLIPTLHHHLTTPHPTDTHLILAAHLHWHDDAPTHLIGDYAYALWNSTTHTLTAARDPMGMRALYYHTTPHHLSFATEITQLLTLPHVPAEIDETMLGVYLCGPYTLPERTHYAGISRLPPAHVLRASAGSHHTRRFWDIDPDHRIRYRHHHDYIDHFRHLFTTAVHDRTRSTSPLGILLSGGMDSGSIASTLGHLRHHHPTIPPIHTYSWAFPTLPQCDERHISDENARSFGFAIHHVSAEEHHPLAHYPRHGPDRDEPFIGAYQALIERALDEARGHGVGVMMSGDRGDLLVGAWILDYLNLARRGRWGDLLGELREHMGIPGASALDITLRHLVRPAFARLAPALRRRVTGFGQQRAAPRTRSITWARTDFLERTGVERVAPRSEAPAEVKGYSRRMRHHAIFVPRQVRNLVWSERTYARFGQSFADPWSDRRLASFVMAIPQQILDPPGEADKRFVRAAMEGIMPEPVRLASAKIVPSPVYHRAMRVEAAATVRDLVRSPQVAERGYVDGDLLREHYEAVQHGAHEDAGFWYVLTLEMWLRRYWT